MTCRTSPLPDGWTQPVEADPCAVTVPLTACAYSNTLDIRVQHGFLYDTVPGGSLLRVGLALAPLLGGSPVGGTEDSLYWGTETLG